jgi:hypothetical protein
VLAACDGLKRSPCFANMDSIRCVVLDLMPHLDRRVSRCAASPRYPRYPFIRIQRAKVLNRFAERPRDLSKPFTVNDLLKRLREVLEPA